VIPVTNRYARHAIPAALLLLATSGPAAAQAILAFDTLPAVVLPAENTTAANWRPLRLAKWSALGASGAAALYGFVNNRRADEAFQGLERQCQEDWDRCLDRLPGGAYGDPALEAEYQRVRHLDGRARTALVVGQIGIATSVVLFILDLRNEQPPPNIPFDPSRLQFTPARDGGVSLGVSLPSR
jgi:hypothetical protein